MPTITETFDRLRSSGEKALVLYVTAGDPSLDELPGILSALDEGGADIIEIGMPFSDPIADGPIIQASTQRALDRGVTPVAVLEAVGKATVEVPLIVMGYYNPLLRLGLGKAAQDLHRAGVSGSIVSDLTPEEADAWVEASRQNGLDNIFLAAPTSTDARLIEVCRRSTGFVYAVSRTGVTGSAEQAPPEVRELVSRIKVRTELPVCVGFGISKPDHVRMVCEVSDGAVIGSWLVEQIADKWRDGTGRQEIVNDIRALKAATKP